MPKYTNQKTGQVFNSATPLNDDQLEELFSMASPRPSLPLHPQSVVEEKPPWYQKPVDDLAKIAISPFVSQNNAVYQMRQGNIGGGIVGAINSGVQQAMLPVTGADYALRQVPFVGNMASKIAQVPGMVLGAPGKMIGEDIATAFPRKDPEQQKYNVEQAGQLGATVSQVAIPEAVTRIAPFVNPARQSVADALSQSAYKIPPGIKGVAREDILHTAQKYGINPTKGGYGKIESALSELKTSQEALENRFAGNGSSPIPKQDLLVSLSDVADKWSKSDTPKDFVDVVRNYRDKILNQQPDNIPLEDAITLKRSLQGQLRDVYAKQMKTNPNLRQSIVQESKAALEQEVRSQIEQRIPGYSDVNSEFTKLLKLEPFVDQAANRISNQDLATIRLKDLMFGGSVGLATKSPIETLGAVITGRIMTDPRVQSWMANKIAPTGTPPFISPMNRVMPLYPSQQDATKQ